MSSTIAATTRAGATSDTAAAPLILMTDPEHFQVSYAINPWMRPGVWAEDAAGHRREARAAFGALRRALVAAGATVETMPGVPGLPDMVFPANAAVVLGRRAVMARFRHPERQGEEAPFRATFEGLVARGLLDEVVLLPEGCLQEGAGDCLWDVGRRLFWVGHGQRSTLAGGQAVGAVFGREVVPLELVSERFYHLDTCFSPLPGGEVLFYPPAFSERSLTLLRQRVPAGQLIEASEQDASRFCVNAVCLGRTMVMASAAPLLRQRLAERGYTLRDLDLSPFILSGGGAFCMTLRLDHPS